MPTIDFFLIEVNDRNETEMIGSKCIASFRDNQLNDLHLKDYLETRMLKDFSDGVVKPLNYIPLENIPSFIRNCDILIQGYCKDILKAYNEVDVFFEDSFQSLMDTTDKITQYTSVIQELESLKFMCKYKYDKFKDAENVYLIVSM